MTVYKRGGVYMMDFQYAGQRVHRSTGQITEDAALAVERKAKDSMRQRAHGVAIDTPADSPRFQDWAEIFFEHKSKRITRPEALEPLVAVSLRFWGAKPEDPAKVIAGAPYHDLRLGDVVADPSWILRWERWLEAPKTIHVGKAGQTVTRAWAGGTKNHYRSVPSQMFKLAMSPQWRQQTGVATNPFAGGWRDETAGRTVTISVDDLRAILAAASFHLRLAVAVGVLAPKLRVGNILALRWDQHISHDFQYITVRDHKTRRKVKRPLVVYVPDQLREILREARRRGRRSRFVITYQGQPITQIQGAVQGAVQRAAIERPHLVYGRDREDGITFHTLRHTAATLLAELEVAPEKRQQQLGHADLATTMKYTHLRPKHEAPIAELLSAHVPIKDLVLVSRLRPPSAETVGSTDRKPAELRRKGRRSA